MNNIWKWEDYELKFIFDKNYELIVAIHRYNTRKILFSSLNYLEGLKKCVCMCTHTHTHARMHVFFLVESCPQGRGQMVFKQFYLAAHMGSTLGGGKGLKYEFGLCPPAYLL